MSLSAKEQCLAQEMVDLKARVKAEMQRRCRNGTLVAYAGTDYDYTVIPETGGKMLVEHVNKIVVPMNSITPSGMTERVVGDQAVAMDVMDAKLTSYSAEPMQKNATSSCSGACSGLCVGGCWNSCSGCGGSCSHSCSGTCSGNCGGCDDACQGSTQQATCSSCKDGCTAYCGMSCWGTCSASWGGSGSGCTSANCTGACTDSLSNKTV